MRAARPTSLDRRGKQVDPETCIEHYTLHLDPLPCWRHLPKEEIRRRITEMVEDIDAQSARRVVLNGRAPVGVEAIRKQHPHTRPEHTKKSPAPAVHAASKAVRKQLKEAYRLFVAAYREAAARLLAGDLTVEFLQAASRRPGRSYRLTLDYPVAGRGRPGHLDRPRAASIGRRTATGGRGEDSRPAAVMRLWLRDG